MPLLKQNEWQLQEAKNRFSEVVRLSQQAPQIVTLHGKPTSVVLSFEEYRALKKPHVGLLELMQGAPAALADFKPERSSEAAMREIAF